MLKLRLRADFGSCTILPVGPATVAPRSKA